MPFVRRSPAMVLILSVLTCGLYYMYWIYQVSDQLRSFNINDSVTPAMELVLSIICFPYVIYWNYKFGKILYEAQNDIGIGFPEDNSVLLMVLSIFGLGLIGACIMQASINKMCLFVEQNHE